MGILAHFNLFILNMQRRNSFHRHLLLLNHFPRQDANNNNEVDTHSLMFLGSWLAFFKCSSKMRKNNGKFDRTLYTIVHCNTKYTRLYLLHVTNDRQWSMMQSFLEILPWRDVKNWNCSSMFLNVPQDPRTHLFPALHLKWYNVNATLFQINLHRPQNRPSPRSHLRQSS